VTGVVVVVAGLVVFVGATGVMVGAPAVAGTFVFVGATGVMVAIRAVAVGATGVMVDTLDVGVGVTVGLGAAWLKPMVSQKGRTRRSNARHTTTVFLACILVRPRCRRLPIEINPFQYLHEKMR